VLIQRLDGGANDVRHYAITSGRAAQLGGGQRLAKGYAQVQAIISLEGQLLKDLENLG